jgi:hypothetical protein
MDNQKLANKIEKLEKQIFDLKIKLDKNTPLKPIVDKNSEWNSKKQE